MKRLYVRPEIVLLDTEIDSPYLLQASAVKVEDGNGNGMNMGGDGEGDARLGGSFFDDDDF